MVTTPVFLLLLQLGQPEIVASTDLPDSWLAAPVSGVATPVERSEFLRVRPIVQNEFKRYPQGVLSHLTRVQVVKGINFFGQPYGGTNSNDTVYLAVDGIANGYTALYISTSFHHELSSILLRKFPKYLDQKAWSQTLPKGFSYSSSGVSAIAQGKASTAVDPRLAAQGFLSQYSQSAQEEDFNVIAQNLFLGGKGFWEVVDKYPSMSAKVKLVINFYNRLDSSFTESSFRKAAS
ncbi:MAG TPA: hypothetical protein VK171_06205 [Fimbriimonas sp.]|nr:hypothetical protein [Fimbriimonas sp.]